MKKDKAFKNICHYHSGSLIFSDSPDVYFLKKKKQFGRGEKFVLHKLIGAERSLLSLKQGIVINYAFLLRNCYHKLSKKNLSACMSVYFLNYYKFPNIGRRKH